MRRLRLQVRFVSSQDGFFMRVAAGLIRVFVKRWRHGHSGDERSALVCSSVVLRALELRRSRAVCTSGFREVGMRAVVLVVRA